MEVPELLVKRVATFLQNVNHLLEALSPVNRPADRHELGKANDSTHLGTPAVIT